MAYACFPGIYYIGTKWRCGISQAFSVLRFVNIRRPRSSQIMDMDTAAIKHLRVHFNGFVTL